MSLRKRGGNWHYRFKYQGREYTGSTDLAATSQNKSKAGQIMSQVLGALKGGKFSAGQVEVVGFAAAVKEFLPYAALRYRERPSSYRRIKTSLSSALVHFGQTAVSAIDAVKLDEYKMWRANEHGVRDITIRHDLHALSVFFHFAIRHQWAFGNPVKDVEIPSDADAERIHVLTDSEEADYFDRAASLPDLHDVGRMMINQGMRPEEVNTLAKTDICLESGEIHIRRGKSKAAKRTLDITAESRRILTSRMPGSSVWIFPSSRKLGSHIGRMNSAHDRVVKAALTEGVTIDFVPYDLRHTFATRAAQKRTDLPTLAALLGHDGIRSVMKYVHPSAEHKKEAMKLIDRSNQDRERQGE